MQRRIVIAFALVGGAFLVAQFVGDGKRGNDTVETSGVEPLPMPLSDSRTEPLAESVNDFADEFEESPNHIGEANVESTDWSPDGEKFVREFLAPERVLSDMFHDNVGRFKRQLEAYYLASNTDDEWSPSAAAILSEWFHSGDNSDQITSDCAADMCVVDLYVSYKVFLRKYREKAKQWGLFEQEGFLRKSFFFPNPDGSIRIYVFRGTFDPESL